jgi:hypothetical protein
MIDISFQLAVLQMAEFHRIVIEHIKYYRYTVKVKAEVNYCK